MNFVLGLRKSNFGQLGFVNSERNRRCFENAPGSRAHECVTLRATPERGARKITYLRACDSGAFSKDCLHPA